MKSSAPAIRERGRPRDPEVADRILAVTLRHLAVHGYSRMSIDGIAEEAGVSKPTMYRRWPNKADLATAALEQVRMGEPPVATGNLGADLQELLWNFRQSLLRPNGMALIGTVLAEEEHTPELLALFRERLVKPRRRMFRAVLEQAQQTGVIAANADLGVAVHMLTGSLYARYLAGKPISREWCNRVAVQTCRGLGDQSFASFQKR